MKLNINNVIVSKIIPYFVLAIFIIFTLSMTLEIHDMNAEIDKLREIILDIRASK